MTNPSNQHISRPLSRNFKAMLIALMTLLIPAISYAAPIASVEPSGSGTATDPYIIQTAENLKYIQKTSATWKEGVYIKQIKDIDLNHDETFGMIGGATDATHFKANYDGGGFEIQNYTLKWSQNKTTICYGLFCVIGPKANVKNIVLRNAHIDIDYEAALDNNLTYAKSDLKIGIFAGVVLPATGNAASTPATRIENISIINSKITGPSQQSELSSLFVGGLVGDIASKYGGSDEMKNSSFAHVIIRNIAVDADIDLSNIIRNTTGRAAGKYTQFNIGGIVGRLRKPRLSDLPSNTYYTGTVNAPRAMVNPVWGMSRSTTNTNDGNKVYLTVAGYSGEYIPDAGGSVLIIGDNGISSAEANKNRYFSAYNVNGHNITDTYPTGDDCMYGTRTLTPNSWTATTQTYDNNVIADMAKFQGVSHATYIANINQVDGGGNNTLLKMYNDYVNAQGDLVSWVIMDGELLLKRPTVLVGEQIDDFTFKADLHFPPETNYIFRWYDDNNVMIGEELKLAPVLDHSSIITVDEIYPKITCSVFDTDNNEICEPKVFIPEPFTAEIVTTDNETYTINSNINHPEDFKYVWYALPNPDGAEMIFDQGMGHNILTIDNPYDYKALRVEVYHDSQLAVSTASVGINYRLAIQTQVAPDGTLYYNASVKEGSEVVMGKKEDGTAVEMPGFVWMWEVSSDPAITTSWETTNLHSWREDEVNGGENQGSLNRGMPLCTINPYNRDRFYRVSWCKILTDEDGNYLYETDDRGNYILRDGQRVYRYRVVMQDVIGPVNLVFVYDKTKTQLGRSTYYNATSFDGTDVLTGAEYPDGSDYNTGYDPYHAVKTLKRAYEVLASKKLYKDQPSMADNNIVIMGFYYPDRATEHRSLWLIGEEDEYASPATISGTYNNYDFNGALNVVSDGDNPSSLGASTMFENITWIGYDSKETDFNTNTKPGFDQCFLYANRHDLTIGQNVKIKYYSLQPKNNGIISTSDAPHITIVGGMHNYGLSELPMPDDTKVPGITTINIFSGNFGRIICAGRNSTNKISATHNIYGTPEEPHRVVLNVNIKHPEAKSTDYVPKDYCEANYHYDIGLLVGGQTDGSVYTETEMNVYNGYIGRFISGNISFGRNTNTETNAAFKYPTDAFYGSTTVNLIGGEIYELFGGSLGRFSATSQMSDKCEAYFYGRSIINIKGGVIKNNIYGAGSGGVSGVGDDLYHTDDEKIPYYVGNELRYGDYNAVKAAGGTDKVPTMYASDNTPISLAHSHCEVNLYSGRVEGNIYGAGYGYSDLVKYGKASPLAGSLFGDAIVRMLPSEIAGKDDPVLIGNIYGGGAGAKDYYEEYLADNPGADRNSVEAFGTVSCVYGNLAIELKAGYIYGSVYGGSQGIEGFQNIAAVTGNVSLLIDASKDSKMTIEGNIFGGAAYADIRRHPDHEGAESHDLSGNTSVTITHGTIGNNIFGGSEGSAIQCAHIDGNTSINITGGTYTPHPYVYNTDGEIVGEATYNIYGGGCINNIIYGNASVYTEKSLLDDPRSIIDDFATTFNNVGFRRYCVYGGGYGAKTAVRGNAKVHINVVAQAGTVPPRGETPTSLVKGQTFYDVAGGGYSGSVGYWANADGTPVRDLDHATLDDYVEYVSGDVSVIIEGFPYIRKVIGGAFYGSVSNADTRLVSGNVQSIYGGSLMGYVHHQAKMTIGTRLDEDHPNASTTNNVLYVVEDVFGGNDVEGIVGTTRWTDDYYNETPVEADGAPLFTADVDPESGNGVDMNIYGGTICGNVYGAGNGNYRGYYMPGWLRYEDGPERQYRKVYLTKDRDPEQMGLVYRNRPIVGVVRMNIMGNNTVYDRVKIRGNVYGGGKSCTVGKWNTILPLEDPRRLTQGGAVFVNFGSHVTVDGNVYLGVRGKEYITQSTWPEDCSLTLDQLVDPVNRLTTQQLDMLGEIAYDHWYLDTERGYVPGFPEPGKLDGNFLMTGEHMYRGYLKNIEMNADVELTFYADPYITDPNDATRKIRRSWLPGELAISEYDATDVIFTNFFMGGQCGSMTNNTPMTYAYGSGDDEEHSAIYRVTLPKGVTVRDKVVGGSEAAQTKYYAFAPDFKSVLKQDALGNAIDPLYVFDGGMVTQTTLGYDLIIYNDIHGAAIDRNPADYLAPNYPDGYQLSNGTVIYRYAYEEASPCLPDNYSLHQRRYHLAVTKDDAGNLYGYAGAREVRDGDNVVKLDIDCKFAPIAAVLSSHDTHYGGVIYGGCYQSGMSDGSVVLNVMSNLMGDHASEITADNYVELASFKHNVGRVFGGGYGDESHINGDVHVNLLKDFVGMNVFGGGCRGDVYGETYINYIGTESNSFVYGGIYGGGLSGSVGIENVTKRATHVNLYSGNVTNVYGGSCMGELFGQANVYLCDEVNIDMPYFDYSRVEGGMDWRGSRLIAGSVYGGNDITGSITNNYDEDTDPEEYKYSTFVVITENPAAGNNGGSGDGPGKVTPGQYNGYNSFPLVGNLYAGSNGDYGVHDRDYYSAGEIVMATGHDADTETIPFVGDSPMRVPTINDAILSIEGGTIVNAFGGGNMATILNSTTIHVDYSDTHAPSETAVIENKIKARAGFTKVDELDRVWQVFGFTKKAQRMEIYSDTGDGYVFNKHIYRLFGGNDNADMDIQPTWDLVSGFVGTVYSGGNFGMMTHYAINEEGKAVGLYLHINSPELRAESVYGGGRVGDIWPTVPTEDSEDEELMEDFYGAKLEITAGIIEHVYGGNDVSGNVHHGSNVLIHGAISGDVYCAGNGNHRYCYDPSIPEGTKIEECYDDDLAFRYFLLPARGTYGDNADDKIKAINSYRPNIERAYMEIEGLQAESPAYVRGSVYCGGNSATIVGPGGGNIGDIRFRVGNYVVLNGVYLGSNGENLTEGEMMRDTESLNGIDLMNGGNSYLLDLYMSAVDVYALPKNFELPEHLIGTYIGDFFIGGNSGSMLVNETINLTFPACLTIYNKIVGGSNNANLTYKGVQHIGGLTSQIESGEKVHLNINCKFEPWRLHYPVDDDDRKIELLPDVVEIDGKWYFPIGKCSVYGGCYNSGLTVGGIGIDIYSDMMVEYDDDYDTAYGSTIGATLNALPGYTSKKRFVADGVNDLSQRAFAVIGAGYGSNSDVQGDVRVRMLPKSVLLASKPIRPNAPKATAPENPHPSVGLLFGGSLMGRVIGNTTVEVRDGLVFTNVYAASEASPMYGSTQTIVGYPQYYICQVQGEYPLNRTDVLSKAATEADYMIDDDDRPTILRQIWLREGDIISPALYSTIPDANKTGGQFTFVDDDLPTDWEDIDISIGYGGMSLPEDEYYGFGNIYGGGYVSATSSVSFAGEYTVCKFTPETAPSADLVGYGGNSTILVWDNKENATADQSLIRDHITIGTAIYKPVSIKRGQNLVGKYKREGDQFIPQGAHPLTEDIPASANTYFVVEADGGIYGGGRKVFVEGFRDCDIAYYGYADYTPQNAKLLNTFQRLDLLTVTDCCMQLQGTTDFTVTKLDGAKYSLTRIGELSMISSIPANVDLNPGTRSDGSFRNLVHSTPRTRNCLVFLNNVHYLAAVTSSQAFTDPYRGADGVLNSLGDYSGETATPNTLDATDYTYRSYKKECIDTYYDNPDNIGAQLRFDQRNLGTAANMLGINNGYVLNIQGGVLKNGNEEIYYGPVTGVFEVKLMTLAPREGGGYVYALNYHDDPNNFLETTGNFIFPGAAYTKTNEVTGIEGTSYNYVFDDCFPMDRGYDHYGNTCNDAQEIHYWYVDGTEFYYNVTLTAFSSTSTDAKFVLNNNENILFLRGVESGTQNLSLDNVIWAYSTNIDSDLQNVTTTGTGENMKYEKDYRLFISVDDRPNQVHTTADKTQCAFVAPISRVDYPYEGGNIDALVDPTDIVSNYRDYSDDRENFPLVGITLLDCVDNSTRPYYDEHLAEPEYVTIELSNTTSAGVTYRYFINLTIKYLLGPTITGLPEIENCALPGEYIFANSFGVKVDMDDATMSVSERNWYVVSGEYDLNDMSTDIAQIVANIDNPDPELRTMGINLVDQKFDDDRQVHIPAYKYMNGWHLIYEIVANGQSFFLHPDVETYDDLFGNAFGFKSLIIHNYHRMRPWDGTSLDEHGDPKLEDLHLVDGSLLYIEDDDDMAFFYQWLQRSQNPSGITTEDGQIIDPQYGEGITIFLMKDVTLPADISSTAAALTFKGTFHGNGNNIDMNGNTVFLGLNNGNVYNTGFVSSTDTDFVVFGKNSGSGHIENCFLYSYNITKGKIDGNLDSEPSDLVNCYRTSDHPEAVMVGGLMKATQDEFEYGEIAYNLNRFYLHSRYLRGNDMPDTDDPDLEPLMKFYRNGDYRFARYSTTGEPDALRTHPIPNYHNYQGKRAGVNIDNYGMITGRDATNHNVYADWDEARAVRDPLTGEVITDEIGNPVAYEPIFPQDYLFFGQELNYDSSEEPYPHTIAFSPRVYRASGFYGSMVDNGFHFNLDAQAVQPTLTAVDFTGFRDYQHGNVYAEGITTYADQVCYYTPMLDLPTRSLQTPDGGIRSFTTNTKVRAELGLTGDNNVTKNLLIYTRQGDDIFDGFIYDRQMLEDEVFGHLIHPSISETNVPDVTVNPTTELFHLVDREDFNCPIAFTVTDYTWYARNPELFSTGNNAWDGLCLPFTVNTVQAVVNADPIAYPTHSHGEISHFYGPYEPIDVEAISHEYWLRKFSALGSVTVNGVQSPAIFFERPASDEDIESGNPQEETRRYEYSNDYFSTAYSLIYDDNTSHAHPQYTSEGLVYENYPMITREMPYLISFPGSRFYEFDLSGTFYAQKHQSSEVIPQRIEFFTPGVTEIKVTDLEQIKVLAHADQVNGEVYSLTGTYMHRKVTDRYTAALSGDLSDCFSFQGEGQVIDPFRVYLTLPYMTPQQYRIRSRFNDSIGDGDPTDGEEPQALTYSVDHSALVVTSPYEEAITLPLFDIEGRLVRDLYIEEGENRYDDLAPGYYIVDSFKFRIN